MNYRHAFHAGNFADVVKHAVLVRILLHLRAKPAGFRVIDTHAGAGWYDLTGPQAARSLEWQNGIQRLLTASIPAPARALLAPYLEGTPRWNPDSRLTPNPGSPLVARAFLRAQDRLVACELEPGEAAALAENLAGDRRAKAVAIDGWTALKAYVPPKERRGVVLIDPPFEDEGDFARLDGGLAAAYGKWPGGTYLLWYPIKGRAAPDSLAKRLRHSAVGKMLCAELTVPAREPGRLGSCGLIVVNPPWTLEKELAVLLPALAVALAGKGAGRFRLDWLSREK